MSLAPLFRAGPLVASHAAAAFAAIGFGAARFASREGTRRHRLLGYGRVAPLAFVALGSFGIHRIGGGGFSPIHVLSVVTLGSLALAVWFARTGRIAAHRQTMLRVYAMARPDRRVHALAGAGDARRRVRSVRIATDIIPPRFAA